MIDLLTDGLAAYRLVRLISRDRITEGLRVRLMLAAYDGHLPKKLPELIGCDWCLGLWVAGGVVAARAVAPKAWRPLSRVLAVGTVVGLIHSLEA